MPIACTLGGIELPADDHISWANVAGVKPVEMEIEVFPEDVKKLLAKFGPLELKTGKGTWTNLWVIREVTGSDPYRAAVVVVDRRWWWQHCHVTARFNMRRSNGVFRIEANNSPELARLENKIAFARYSVTPDNSPWNTKSILSVVLGEILNYETEQSGQRPAVIYESESQGAAPLNDVEVDTSGDMALNQILGMIAGYSLRVDPDGSVVFFSTVTPDAGDAELVELGEQFEGGGNARIVSHVNECPRAVRVYFSIETELRFDYKDIDPTATAEADPNESLRLLKNVIPNPDYSLTVDGVSTPQDTYIEADKLFASLPALPGGGRLTDKMSRMAMMPYCDLYQAICDLSDFDESGDWRTRINVVMANLLQTFRIPRDWHDRALTWKNIRVATVNQATGSRSPAMAFGDYALMAAMKRRLRSFAAGARNGQIEFGRNFDGWQEEISDTAKPAACKVEVDAELGIVNLQYLTDPFKKYDMAFPAAFDTGVTVGRRRQSNAPDDDMTPLTFDSVAASDATPAHLTQNHRVAVYLTGIPAAPNDKRQFFCVTVTPDRDGVIYDTARAAKGPVMEVRVQPAYEVARLPWRDDKKDEYAKLFGVMDGAPDLTGLCVNKEPGSELGGVRGEGGRTVGASLDEIARNIAERIWASFVPHVQGSADGDMNLDVVPRGWLDAVQHTVSPDGTMSTRAVWPKRGQTLDWINFVSPSVRAVVLRQVYRG